MRTLRAVLVLASALALVAQEAAPIHLPPAPTAGGPSLASALRDRATVRSLAGPAPSLAEASQLLWAAQGENRPGRRTAPSAHAKYPLEVYLVTAGTQDLPAGVYHYRPSGHLAAKVGEGNPETVLGPVKGMQGWIKGAPAVFVVAGEPSRIDPGPQGLALTWYEAGAAAQGLLLQAAALNLGAGTAVGVDMAMVGKALKLPAGTQALVLLPVGHPKQ